MKLMNKTVQIMLFEDNEDMREGLTWLLRSQTHLKLLGAFADANDVKNIITQYSPDIVLMDIQMPGLSGIEALKIIKAAKPATHVVILTTFADEDSIFNAMRHGASGYLLKANITNEIFRAIQEVMDGGSPMNARVARKVMAYFSQTPQNTPDYHLTSREKEILVRLTEGDSTKMIARMLFISEQTVGNHIRHIYEKLAVHSRGEAVAKAIRENIV
jgi:DNA-binding NarL/FixJ family response regulator